MFSSSTNQRENRRLDIPNFVPETRSNPPENSRLRTIAQRMPRLNTIANIELRNDARTAERNPDIRIPERNNVSEIRAVTAELRANSSELRIIPTEYINEPAEIRTNEFRNNGEVRINDLRPNTAEFRPDSEATSSESRIENRIGRTSNVDPRAFMPTSSVDNIRPAHSFRPSSNVTERLISDFRVQNSVVEIRATPTDLRTGPEIRNVHWIDRDGNVISNRGDFFSRLPVLNLSRVRQGNGSGSSSSISSNNVSSTNSTNNNLNDGSSSQDGSDEFN